MFEVADDPGDGNCWVYAAFHSFNNTVLDDTEKLEHPQVLREWIYLFLKLCHRKQPCCISDRSYRILSSMLQISRKDSVLSILSKTFQKPKFVLAAELFRIGTPNKCLWSGVFGIKITLLAIVLQSVIIVLTEDKSSARSFELTTIEDDMGSCIIERNSKNRVKIRINSGSRQIYYISDIVMALSFSKDRLSIEKRRVLVIFDRNTENHFQAVLNTQTTSCSHIHEAISKVALSGTEYSR